MAKNPYQQIFNKAQVAGTLLSVLLLVYISLFEIIKPFHHPVFAFFVGGIIFLFALPLIHPLLNGFYAFLAISSVKWFSEKAKKLLQDREDKIMPFLTYLSAGGSFFLAFSFSIMTILDAFELEHININGVQIFDWIPAIILVFFTMHVLSYSINESSIKQE